MRLFRQIYAVTTISVGTLGARAGSLLVVVVGVATVVGVLVSVLAMSAGFQRTIESTGRADRAMVLSNDVQTEASSSLSPDDVAYIANAPGIKIGPGGRHVYSADTIVIAPVTRRSDGSDAYATLRGVSAGAMTLRPEIHIVDGRLFRPGVYELMVGRRAQEQFAGLELGRRIRLNQDEWTIVGSYTSEGSAHESELLGDITTVMSAYRTRVNSVTVLLEDVDSLGAFRSALSQNEVLSVDVIGERDYFARVARPFGLLLRFVAYAIGGIMGIGVLLGATNTMYCVLVARVTEIALLRAIGFQGNAIVIALSLEAVLFSIVGAAIGTAIAYLALNGNVVSTLGGAIGNAQLVYSMAVSREHVVLGALIACTIGLLGGLLPAIRAARVPVTSALRTK